MPGSSPGMTDKEAWMFDSLSERLNAVLDRLTRRGALSEADVEAALAGSAAGADRSRRRPRRRPRLHRRGEEARRRGRGHQIGHARPDGREDRARPIDRDPWLERAADRPQCAGPRRHHDGGIARLGQNHHHRESRQAPCRDGQTQGADGFARHAAAGGDGATRRAGPAGQRRYFADRRRTDAGADRDARAASGAARRLRCRAARYRGPHHAR